jgi:hypothetical protein
MTSEAAVLELTLRTAEQSESSFDDVIVLGLRSGLPAEVLTRMQDFWDKTLEIAGEGIAIGKIVLNEIAAFITANPALAVGAAIGAAVGVLISSVPLLGSLLAPIAKPLCIFLGTGYGALVQDGDDLPTVLKAARALANKFFELLVSILRAVSAHFARPSGSI